MRIEFALFSVIVTLETCTPGSVKVEKEAESEYEVPSELVA